jgi:hypothetical protein
MNWLNLPGCPPLWVVWFLQLVSNFCCLVAAFSRGFFGGFCFCFTSTESLILAQDERWRRA